MKKKIIVCLLATVLTFTLCACDADEVNETIDKVADSLSSIEVEQEDLDKAEQAIKDIADKAVDIATDPGVQDALKDGAEAITDAITDNDKTE